MNPTDIAIPDPTLYVLLADQIAMNRNLLYMTWALIFLISTLLVLQIFRHIRRFTGLKSTNNHSDPLDDVRLGHFMAGMRGLNEEAQKRAAAAVSDIKETMEGRFHAANLRLNAIDKQLETSRRKDSKMLLILYDLRAFMIYHKMPSREMIPLDDMEKDEEGAI